MTAEADQPQNNRERKILGREKRRRHVQGTRAYTHAMLNSIVRRAAEKVDRNSDKT